jgi:hypothetical protein
LFKAYRVEARVNQNANNKIDLSRLRDRLQQKPRTKVAQIRQAWPDVKALLDAGHSLKDICNWLNEAGIEIGYARLSDYTRRLRRHNQVTPLADTAPPDPEDVRASDRPRPELTENTLRKTRTEAERALVENDPLANIRERERQRPGFQYNSEPDIKKLI